MTVPLLIVAIFLLLHVSSTDLIREYREDGQLNMNGFIQKAYAPGSQIEVVARIDSQLYEGRRGIVQSNSGKEICLHLEDGHTARIYERDFSKIKAVEALPNFLNQSVAQQPFKAEKQESQFCSMMDPDSFFGWFFSCCGARRKEKAGGVLELHSNADKLLKSTGLKNLKEKSEWKNQEEAFEKVAGVLGSNADKFLKSTGFKNLKQNSARKKQEEAFEKVAGVLGSNADKLLKSTGFKNLKENSARKKQEEAFEKTDSKRCGRSKYSRSNFIPFKDFYCSGSSRSFFKMKRDFYLQEDAFEKTDSKRCGRSKHKYPHYDQEDI